MQQKQPNIGDTAILEPNRLMSEHQACSILPMSVHWYRKKRVEGGGPRFVKIGRRVLYRVSDLIDFADKHERTNTSRPSNA